MGPEGGICCMPALRGGPGSRMLLGPEPGPIPIWPPIMYGMFCPPWEVEG